MTDGIQLEYLVYSTLRALGMDVQRADEQLDKFHGTDLILTKGDQVLFVGVTCRPSKSKVLCDFEKARKKVRSYAELFFDPILIDGEEKVEDACLQAKDALEFLAGRDGFYLVTLDGGRRAKIDVDLQKKMAADVHRYAVAF